MTGFFKFIGFIISFLGLAVPVLAADGLNLITSPLPLILSTDPGSTISAQLKVKNGGNETAPIEIGLMKFTAYDDGGLPRLLDREVGDSYFDWVTFSETEFDLAPNEWKTISMDIAVPAEAGLGYYYAITFSRKNQIQDQVGPRATQIVGATASLVLLNVRTPNAIREIEVVEYNSPKKIYEFLPVNFNLKLKNKGNVHLAPRGNIFISQGNKQIDILEINNVSGNILPNSSRTFETIWAGGFPEFKEVVEDEKILLDKQGKPIKRLNWDLAKINKLRIGKFQADLFLVYDDGQRDVPIEGSLTFWVMPWRIIGVGLVVGILILVGVYAFLRMIWRSLFGRKK